MSEQTIETPILDLLAGMTADSIEASNLDPQTLMLVRIAALVAVDAPPASYLMNLGAASELDVDAEQVRGVLAAVAPIVGTARVISATSRCAGARARARSPPARGRDRGRSLSRSGCLPPDREGDTQTPSLPSATRSRTRWATALVKSDKRINQAIDSGDYDELQKAIVKSQDEVSGAIGS